MLSNSVVNWTELKTILSMARKNRNKDLGRSIANRRERDRAEKERLRREGNDNEGTRHMSQKSGRPQLISVLDSTDLEDLMNNATLSNRTFEAERYAGPVAPQTVVVTPLSATTPAQKKELRDKQRQLDKNSLRVPRRPSWNVEMTRGELLTAENEAFLKWRRDIAMLEDEVAQQAKIELTPFEKNLEVWRQLWRVVERADVVVQIVDARNPLMYYCDDLVRWVTTEMGRAHTLVLNKADLLSNDMISRWEKYFADIGVDVVFFSAFKASVGEATDDDRVIGAQQLIERLSNSPRTAPVERPEQRLVVGMCGYPNVGKSSTINVLLEHVAAAADVELEEAESMSESNTNSDVAKVTSKRVAVSATPGRTKHFQTLVLTDDVMLCDCPGLVFPNFSASKSELICAGVLSIDQMRTETHLPIELIASRIPAAIFEAVYGIRFETDNESLLNDGAARKRLREGYVDASLLLDTHARARGYMTAGHGLPDRSRSARVVLRDYVSGRVRYAHCPPGAGVGESGVGPDVFAKKGKLVVARREIAEERKAVVEKVTDEAELELETEQRNPAVVARISMGKKHKHKEFTRVVRSY